MQYIPGRDPLPAGTHRRIPGVVVPRCAPLAWILSAVLASQAYLERVHSPPELGPLEIAYLSPYWRINPTCWSEDPEPDSRIERHYVSERSSRHKGVLRFLARDVGARNFADSSLRKSEQSDAILSFIRTWKDRTGAYPMELAFDRKLTTHANPARSDQLGIRFLTVRRRSARMPPPLPLVAATLAITAARRASEGVWNAVTYL